VVRVGLEADVRNLPSGRRETFQACGEAMPSLACMEDPEVVEKSVTRLFTRRL